MKFVLPETRHLKYINFQVSCRLHMKGKKNVNSKEMVLLFKKDL